MATGVVVLAFVDDDDAGAEPTWYTLSLFGPPQYSDELPLQTILQPSDARLLPLDIALPQSAVTSDI